MTSIFLTSLAPFFPKDLQSSPFVSAGAGLFSAAGFCVGWFRAFLLLALVLLPLVPLVPFMMTLLSFLVLMVALIQRALCSLP